MEAAKDPIRGHYLQELEASLSSFSRFDDEIFNQRQYLSNFVLLTYGINILCKEPRYCPCCPSVYQSFQHKRRYKIPVSYCFHSEKTPSCRTREGSSGRGGSVSQNWYSKWNARRVFRKRVMNFKSRQFGFWRPKPLIKDQANASKNPECNARH